MKNKKSEKKHSACITVGGDIGRTDASELAGGSEGSAHTAARDGAGAGAVPFALQMCGTRGAPVPGTRQGAGLRECCVCYAFDASTRTIWAGRAIWTTRYAGCTIQRPEYVCIPQRSTQCAHGCAHKWPRASRGRTRRRFAAVREADKPGCEWGHQAKDQQTRTTRTLQAR